MTTPQNINKKGTFSWQWKTDNQLSAEKDQSNVSRNWTNKQLVEKGPIICQQ